MNSNAKCNANSNEEIWAGLYDSVGPTYTSSEEESAMPYQHLTLEARSMIAPMRI